MSTQPDTKQLVETDAVDDEGDIVKVPIDEWKRLYGEPGPLTDQHGRIWGYFPTEPCFCEDSEDA